MNIESRLFTTEAKASKKAALQEVDIPDPPEEEVEAILAKYEKGKKKKKDGK